MLRGKLDFCCGDECCTAACRPASKALDEADDRNAKAVSRNGEQETADAKRAITKCMDDVKFVVQRHIDCPENRLQWELQVS